MPALTLARLNGYYPVFAAFELPFRTVRNPGHFFVAATLRTSTWSSRAAMRSAHTA